MLSVDSRPIYSVVATERSFIQGVTRLEKRFFVRMLLQKVAGHKLPTELLALIDDHLWDYYWTNSGAKRWARLDELWRKRHQTLLWDNFMTKTALDAWSKLARDLNLTPAAREGPLDRRDGGSRSGNYTTPLQHVVHLARPGRYSHGDMALRPSVAPPLLAVDPQAADQTGVNKDLRTSHLLGGMCYTNFHEHGGTFNVSYMPKRNGTVLDQAEKVERFVEFDGVEEEIRAWDDDAVRKCVDVLGLEMVGTGDALRPKLRLVQAFVGSQGGLVGRSQG